MSAGTEDAGFAVRAVAAALPNRIDDPSCGCDVAVRRAPARPDQVGWRLIFVGEALTGEPVVSPRLKTATGWRVTLRSSSDTSIPSGAAQPRSIRAANKPMDLIEIAAAIPTPHQTHHHNNPDAE